MFETKTENGCTIIEINDSIYPDNCSEIVSCFNEAISSNSHRIVMDLGRVEVIYSSGITNLVQFFTQLKAQNRELVLVGVQDGVMKVFKLLGLHQLFIFADNLEIAVESGS